MHDDETPTQTPDVPLTLRERLWPHRRDTFQPVFQDHDAAPGQPWSSRFGGLPCLALSYMWPMCSACGLPQTFLLQLDLATIPAPCTWQDTEGLVQLFFCTRCMPVGPSAPGISLRLMPPQPWTIPGLAPPGAVILPERLIKGWHGPLDDLPAEPPPPEGDPLSAPLSEEDRENQRALNISGDKQGGWPHWLQDPEPLTSPRSGQPLNRLLLQFDTTAGHLPIELGDSGIGYIFQSADDPTDLGFIWQCL